MWQSHAAGGQTGPAVSVPERIAMAARFSVPDNEVPAGVAFTAVLARTGEAAVSVSNLQVHSVGFAFTVAARTRHVSERNDLRLGRGPLRMGEPGGVLSEEFLRIAVVFADGRVATNLAGHRLRTGGPIPAERPILSQGHGSSGGRRADATYWLTPLPPPGPVVFVCEWPGHGIGESRAELDASLILDAVSRVVTLWPPEPLPTMATPAAPVVPGSGLFASAASELARHTPPTHGPPATEPPPGPAEPTEPDR